MRRVLAAAEVYYVAPNMVELATAVAASMPAESLLIHDLPSLQGFMMLGTPVSSKTAGWDPDLQLKLPDVGNIHGVLWSARGGRVRVWLLSLKSDPADGQMQLAREKFDEATWRSFPTLPLLHCFWLHLNSPLPHLVNRETGEILEETSLPAAILLAIWRLCQQSLADRHLEPMPRGMRKQIQRMNVPDKPVTVVTLRRRADQPQGDSTVEWSHRWIVRGHWRNQRVKDDDGNWVTRVIYINPHIKGPEDKPLLNRQHVYGLYR